MLEVQQYCDQLQLSTTIKTDLSWSNYNHLCATMNRRMYGLADKLIELGLNESDIRLCVLVMTNKKQREIAEILNYSPKSIGKMKDITAQKMGVNGGQLRDRLLQIVCS